MDIPAENSPPSHLQDHIEIVARLEQEFQDRRTASDRVGDTLGSLIGSLNFVLIHLAVFGGWIILNTWPVTHHFDPYPYPILDLFGTLEAIFLASFIVMRQTRTSRRSDERDHLILQILLLTEKEITAIVGVERQIAAKIGLHGVAHDAELEQFSQHTSIDEVAQIIQEHLPGE